VSTTIEKLLKNTTNFINYLRKKPNICFTVKNQNDFKTYMNGTFGNYENNRELNDKYYKDCYDIFTNLCLGKTFPEP
jgi:hypothetical protein